MPDRHVSPRPAEDDIVRIDPATGSPEPYRAGSQDCQVVDSAWLRRLDSLLAVQRPVVVKHVAALRRRHR